MTDAGENGPVAGAAPPLRIEKGWKFYLGIGLLIYSFVPWGVLAVLPFLSVSGGQAAGLATVALLSAELAGLTSIALLGKPIITFLKNKVWNFLKRREPELRRPIGRTRHAIGITMLFVSMVGIYPLALIPFLELTRNLELNAVLATLIACDLLFLASLLVLGSDFWERLNRLFEWPGAAAPHPEPPQ